MIRVPGREPSGLLVVVVGGTHVPVGVGGAGDRTPGEERIK